MDKKIKVFGNRVLVQKEKIDVGGLRLTPTQEEDGKKNTGKIISVGHVGLINRLRGIKEGATIHFRKYFICNDGMDDSLVFVDIESITGINQD